MSLKSFVREVNALAARTGKPDAVDSLPAVLQVQFDQLGAIVDLASANGLAAEPSSRYTCYVDVPGGSDSAIEVTATLPTQHVAQAYANCLFSLEVAIAQTSDLRDVRLEELLTPGAPQRDALWDRAAIWLGEVLPKVVLEGELGSPLKPISASAEVLAALLADAGVGSHLTGEGISAFGLGSRFRVMALIDHMKTARLLARSQY